MAFAVLDVPYFPFVVAGVAAVLILLTICLVVCCCRQYHMRQRKKLDGLYSGLQPSLLLGGASLGEKVCLYPAGASPLGGATAVQPDPGSLKPLASAVVYGLAADSSASSSSDSGTPANGSGTPVHTPPAKSKKGGLLGSRRGSVASLTLDLRSMNQLESGTKWGSPPRECTAEEFLASASNKLSRKQLRFAATNVKALHEEFWEIPMNHPSHVRVPGSGMKNRYKTIIPNEHSRVKLPDVEDDALAAYINANYIRGYGGRPRVFIATQGPLSNTVDEFWRLVWHETVPIIVMVTRLTEKNRAKCERYLPAEDTVDTFGNFRVVVDSVVEADGYSVRNVSVQKLGDSTAEWRQVVHYWYTAWPDHKTPEMARQMLGLVRDVDNRRRELATLAPSLVHCSAGIGRTGCFIATSIGIEQLRSEGYVDVLAIVCQMRQDRGGLIQTNEQYEFVYQALALYERELPTSTESPSSRLS